MFDSLFTVENLLNVLGTFVYLFGELFLLFVAISFFVALLQVWVSKDRIKRILSRPHKVTNAILGAALGNAVLLVLHHPRLGGPLQERRALLRSYLVPDDLPDT